MFFTRNQKLSSSRFGGRDQQPKREFPLDFKIVGLGRRGQASGFIEDVASYLECAGLQSEKLCAFGDELASIEIFDVIKSSPLSGNLECCILPLILQMSIEGTDIRSTRAEEPLESKVVLFLRTLKKEEDAETIAREMLRKFLIEMFSLGNPRLWRMDLVLIFPFLPRIETTIMGWDNPFPTYFITTSKAGSGFAGPSVRALAAKCNRRVKFLDIVNQQHFRLIRNIRNENEKGFAQFHYDLAKPEITEIQSSFLLSASYYDFFKSHQVPAARFADDIPFADIIVLMRDPRDMVVSHTHYMAAASGFQMSGDRMKEYCRDLIENDVSLLAKEFVQYMARPNVFVVRYEDIWHDAFATYCGLLSWLGWGNALTRQDMKEIVEAGDFSKQAGGRFNRGEREKFIKTEKGWSLRKGIIGDWRNFFCDELKNISKQAMGDELIALGYEKSPDW